MNAVNKNVKHFGSINALKSRYNGDNGDSGIVKLKKIHLKDLRACVRQKFKTHRIVPKVKDVIMKEMYNGSIKFNLALDIKTYNGGRYLYPTSISLKKSIVSLWLVMMEKIHCDHNKVIIEFIQDVCLKKWYGDTAKGLSDFIQKCMLYSMLEEEDWQNYKMVYKALNGRVNNPRSSNKPDHGEYFVKHPVEENEITKEYHKKILEKKSSQSPQTPKNPVKKKFVFKTTKASKTTKATKKASS